EISPQPEPTPTPTEQPPSPTPSPSASETPTPPPSDGSLLPSLSRDARLVAFTSNQALTPRDDNGTTDVFVRRRETHETELISMSTSGESGNGPSSWAAVSADGT